MLVRLSLTYYVFYLGGNFFLASSMSNPSGTGLYGSFGSGQRLANFKIRFFKYQTLDVTVHRAMIAYEIEPCSKLRSSYFHPADLTIDIIAFSKKATD